MTNRFVNNKTIGFLFIILCALTIGYFIASSLIATKNPYGDEIIINDLDTYTEGLPKNKDRLQFIQNRLYETVKINSPSARPGDITDTTVRKGSFSQEYKKEYKRHSVNFITDIPSLRQSYNISYQWLDPGQDSIYLDQYGTVVTCVKKDKAIYQDFSCKDLFEAQKTHYEDPILEFLPYSSGTHKVTYNHVRRSLDIDIYIPAAYVRSGEENIAIDKAKAEISDWIRGHGLNPDNYPNPLYTITKASIY